MSESEKPVDDEPTMIQMWERISAQDLNYIATAMGMPVSVLALTKISKIIKYFVEKAIYAQQMQMAAYQQANNKYQQQAYPIFGSGTTSSPYQGTTTGITWTTNSTLGLSNQGGAGGSGIFSSTFGNWPTT